MIAKSLDDICEFIRQKRLASRNNRTQDNKASNDTKKKTKQMQIRSSSARPLLAMPYKDKILELYDKGYTVNKIATELGISYSSVYTLIKKFRGSVEPRGNLYKVYRDTLEVLAEYVLNPSAKQLKKKYGGKYISRIQDILQYTSFPRPRFLKPDERREVHKAIVDFLKEHPNKEVFTIHELSPLIEKVQKYYRVWGGKVNMVIEDMVKLWEEGLNARQIAKKLGISDTSVRKTLKKLGIFPYLRSKHNVFDREFLSKVIAYIKGEIHPRSGLDRIYRVIKMLGFKGKTDIPPDLIPKIEDAIEKKLKEVGRDYLTKEELMSIRFR